VQRTVECCGIVHSGAERELDARDCHQLRRFIDCVCFPKTANAAAEWKNGTMFIGTISSGSFVVAHANNAQTDRIFLYAAFG
jgi:hypothetical protein